MKKKLICLLILFVTLCKASASEVSDLSSVIKRTFENFIYSIDNVYNPYESAYTDSIVAQSDLETISLNYSISYDFNISAYQKAQSKVISQSYSNSFFDSYKRNFERVTSDIINLITMKTQLDFLEENVSDADSSYKVFQLKQSIPFFQEYILSYSGISVTEKDILVWKRLLDETSFEEQSYFDIHEFGIVKNYELAYSYAIREFNERNKTFIGYLPSFSADIGGSIGIKELGSQRNLQLSTNMSIPNLGLTINYRFSGNNSSSLSIFVRYPFNDWRCDSIPEPDYSFSSESFLMNLNNMLYKYSLRDESVSEYDRISLRNELLKQLIFYEEFY